MTDKAAARRAEIVAAAKRLILKNHADEADMFADVAMVSQAILRATSHPWRVRMSWSVRGYVYFVDVSSQECLDVARALWLTGADHVSLSFQDGMTDSFRWSYYATHGAFRGVQLGGYSNQDK